MRHLLALCFKEIFGCHIVDLRCQYDRREENEELLLKLRNELCSVIKGYNGDNVELTAGEA